MTSCFAYAVFDAFHSKIAIHGIQFNADIMPIKPLCHRARRAAAEERIKDNAAHGAASKDACFREHRRISGKVPALVGHGIDPPHIPLISELRDIRICISHWSGVVDSLMLLTGDVMRILVVRPKPPLHARHGRRRHRLGNRGGVEEIAAGLG